MLIIDDDECDGGGDVKGKQANRKVQGWASLSLIVSLSFCFGVPVFTQGICSGVPVY